VGSGSNISVLNHNPAGWSRVQSGNSTGYIRSDFLMFPVSNAATFRTTEGVNVRASGSTSSNILQTVARGTSVEVTEHNPAGWSRVRVGNTNGFIRSDFLTRGNNVSSASNTATTDTVISTLKTTGAVNLRSGSSTDTSIIRTLASNTSVEVLENQANGWSRVRHNGTNGFIRSDLISATGSSQQQIMTLRTTGAVNFRAGASTNDRIIRTLAANTSVSVLANQANGWSQVSHNGTNGFIRSDLLSEAGATNTSGNVIGTRWTVAGVNMRSGSSTSHSIIRLLPRNTSVEILENLTNGWSRVRHNGTVGFIRSDLLNAERSNANSSLGQQIADFARGYEGHRYTWGGTSPATGFDCSGFVTYVLRNFGISVSRTSAQQFRDNGVPVSRAELQPGDLVFFARNGVNVNHVGIYIGGDRFIHAQGTGVGVVITPLSSRTWFGARRVV